MSFCFLSMQSAPVLTEVAFAMHYCCSKICKKARFIVCGSEVVGILAELATVKDSAADPGHHFQDIGIIGRIDFYGCACLLLQPLQASSFVML